MEKYTVKLTTLRNHDPCEGSWRKLLDSLDKTRADDTEVSIDYILDLLGLDDALWALRALPEEYDNEVRLLICDLVEPALEYTDDPRPAETVRVARAYARGTATWKDLAAAGDAAGAAARDAAGAAAGAAARAAARDAAGDAAGDAARAAAGAAAGDAARDVQRDTLREWLGGAK